MQDVKEFYSKDVCIILGVALLYFIFTPDGKNTVPLFIVKSVLDEYRRLYHKELTENPVEKMH